MVDEHLTSLPGTGWHAWRSALLRSAGCPADGTARFGAPALARVADAYMDGAATEAELGDAFDAALRALDEAVYATAADPTFRTALTWQNPSALIALDGVLR